MWAIGAWVSDRAKRAQLNLKTPLSIKAKKMKEAGENIIDFSYMSFDAPPQSVIYAVKEALTSGYPKPELRGLPTLRKIVAEETKLKKRIEEYSKLKCIPSFMLDEDLIGGFTVQVKDTILDASVQRQLQLLRSKFKESNTNR